MITNIDNKLKVCGIYKINYSNGKIYIGQALSIYSRALEHNNKNRYPCDKALKKYSATIEILEKVDDVLLLDEIESHWIDKFNATDKNIGYNILKEGNASGKRGIENCNAALNQEQLNEIIDLLINNLELTFEEIGDRFNVSSSAITRINQGYTYTNLNLQYPIRDINYLSRKKRFNDYFDNEQDLINLKEDLLYRWDIPIENGLDKQYNIPLRIIRDINNGRRFEKYGDYIYPIRKKNIRNNRNFTQLDILSILNELRNTKNSMSEIGKKFQVDRNTISKINKGEAYIIKDYKYPARN